MRKCCLIHLKNKYLFTGLNRNKIGPFREGAGQKFGIRLDYEYLFTGLIDLL